MNLERYYKWCNLIALSLASFCLGGVMYADYSMWYPIIIMATPTVILLTIVVALLAWSFYLTRKDP